MRKSQLYKSAGCRACCWLPEVKRGASARRYPFDEPSTHQSVLGLLLCNGTLLKRGNVSRQVGGTGSGWTRVTLSGGTQKVCGNTRRELIV